MRTSSTPAGLLAQAQATRQASDALHLAPLASSLMKAAATTIESLARSQEKKLQPLGSNVLTLPANATAFDVRTARRRRAVRHGEDVFLPTWQEATFGLPNAFLRSALFSVVRSDNQMLLDAPIAAQGDTVLKLTGNPLLDYDRQVFAVLLSYYAADRPLQTSAFCVTFWQFAKAMDLGYSKKTHTAIRNSLIRLNAAHLRLRVARLDIPLPRLVEVVFEDSYQEASPSESLHASDVISFCVPQGMAELFGPSSWTAVPAEALTDSSGLQRWLSSYYATHSKPYALRIVDLYNYSGSDCGLAQFRRRLKSALTNLQSAEINFEVRIANALFEEDRDELTVRLARWGA